MKNGDRHQAGSSSYETSEVRSAAGDIAGVHGNRAQQQARPPPRQEKRNRQLQSLAIDCDGNIRESNDLCRTVFCTRNYGVVFVALCQVLMGFITATVQVIWRHDVQHPSFVLNMLIAMLSIVMGIATVASLGVRIKSILSSLLMLMCLFVIGMLGSSLTRERWALDVGDKENNKIVQHTNWDRCMAMEGTFKDDCLLHFTISRLFLLVLAVVQLAFAVAATAFIFTDALCCGRRNRVASVHEEEGEEEAQAKETGSAV